MSLELVPLRPEHADEYLAFFDRAFADNPAWSGRYCGFYEDPCSDGEWSPAEGEVLRDCAGAAPQGNCDGTARARAGTRGRWRE